MNYGCALNLGMDTQSKLGNYPPVKLTKGRMFSWAATVMRSDYLWGFVRAFDKVSDGFLVCCGNQYNGKSKDRYYQGVEDGKACRQWVLDNSDVIDIKNKDIRTKEITNEQCCTTN